MMSVFDSSAIYKAIRTTDISMLAGAYTVPLALYELGNIVLKSSLFENTYSSQEAQTLLKSCQITLNLMRIVIPDNLPYIYQIASRLKLSFYDAVYVCLAKDLNMPLVTLDKKLINKAHAFIQVTPFESLQK